ncbi:MAG TPA: TIGR04283 family arsenosugar biosynthesis glycosyltransferase, partial [Methanoregula sp.]|nr:TIGR04283 family arsenosugar biosynthesis glycosyltransferase [Methanoregula sp.]
MTQPYIPRISIITPVLNEEDMLTSFLDHLALLQGPFELLIVDGNSSDATRARIQQYASPFPVPLHLLSAPAGRSGQMNTGAAAAQGEILLFLHVDCRIPEDSLQVITHACAENGVCGGAFIHSFGEPGLFNAVIGLLVNKWTKYTQTFFGDFGIFVQRDVFFQAGGFELIPFCEDLEFCRSVRRYGRMKQINRVIRSSPRRFQRIGRVKLTVVYLLAIVLNMAGIRPLFLKRSIV